MVFRDLLNQYLDNLDRNMKIYLVIAFAFLLIYGWFIRTAFKGPKFLCRFIVKKILLAFILGVFLPFCDPVNKGSPLNALSLAFVLIYSSYKLSLDCPKGYAENILPILKTIFTLESFFIFISFDKEDCCISIISGCILLAISFLAIKSRKQDFIQDRSEYIEVVLFCIEHALSLIIAALLTDNALLQVLLIAVNKEIIIAMVHLFLMYIVKIVLKEDVSQYCSEKRSEMLRSL